VVVLVVVVGGMAVRDLARQTHALKHFTPPPFTPHQNTSNVTTNKTGFTDVKIKRIGPSWYRGVRRHGLIMGCSVTGVKAAAGESPLELGPPAEVSSAKPGNPLVFALRMLLGVAAGFYYFVLPIYMYLKHLVWPKNWEM
jgi:hypothetical protein